MSVTNIENLPTVYDAQSTEEKMYKFWEDGGYFKAELPVLCGFIWGVQENG